MNVNGIGEKRFLKLKPLLTVSDKADRAGLPDHRWALRFPPRPDSTSMVT